MTRQRAMERVLKLRALAAPGSGAGRPEQQLARQRADQLMAKHGLAEHEVVAAQAHAQARAHPRPQPPPAPRPTAPPGAIWFTPTSTTGAAAPFTVTIFFT